MGNRQTAHTPRSKYDTTYNPKIAQLNDAQIKEKITTLFGGNRQEAGSIAPSIGLLDMHLTEMPTNLAYLDGGARRKKTKSKTRKPIESRLNGYAKYDISKYLTEKNRTKAEQNGGDNLSAISVSELDRMRNIILADNVPGAQHIAQTGAAYSVESFAPLGNLSDTAHGQKLSLVNLLQSHKIKLAGGACDDMRMSDSEAVHGGGRTAASDDDDVNDFSSTSSSNNLNNSDDDSDDDDNNKEENSDDISSVGGSDNSYSSDLSSSNANSFREESNDQHNNFDVAPFYSSASATDYSFQQPHIKSRFD